VAFVSGTRLTAAELISRLDNAITHYGQTVTLQRTNVDPASGAVAVTDSIDCPAAVRPSGPQDLEAGEVVPIRIVVSPTGLGDFGLPNRDDRLLIDGNPTNIQQVAPLYFAGQLVRVNLLCRG
jgi:hypothetical protein